MAKKFFPQENVFLKYGGEAFEVIECNGSVTKVRNAAGETCHLMIGDLISYGPHLLINQETGDIDMVAVHKIAAVRAMREFGSANYPPAYLRDAINFYMSAAQMMHHRRRAELGLPDLQEYAPMSEMLARGLEQYGAN